MFILTYKYCPKCEQWQGLGEFGKDKSRKDGLSCYCRKCKTKNTKHYRNKRAEYYREYDRQRYQGHVPEFIEKAKAWASENLEKRLEISRRWDHANREYSQVKTQNRRAKIKGNGGSVTKAEWKALKEKYGNKCLYPGCENTKLTMDHIVPVELGGKTAIDNIQPLCQHHNSSKGAKVIDYRV
jgi:5-methylcytosine-specific restriction endonuclease McrA